MHMGSLYIRSPLFYDPIFAIRRGSRHLMEGRRGGFPDFFGEFIFQLVFIVFQYPKFFDRHFSVDLSWIYG